MGKSKPKSASPSNDASKIDLFSLMPIVVCVSLAANVYFMFGASSTIPPPPVAAPRQPRVVHREPPVVRVDPTPDSDEGSGWVRAKSSPPRSTKPPKLSSRDKRAVVPSTKMDSSKTFAQLLDKVLPKRGKGFGNINYDSPHPELENAMAKARKLSVAAKMGGAVPADQVNGQVYYRGMYTRCNYCVCLFME